MPIPAARSEQQRWTVGQRLAEQHPVHSQVSDQHRADTEGRRAEHAEETQRLLREAHQEEDAEQIQQVMHVFARAVDAPMAVLRRLPHRDLADAEAEAHRQDRHEAMLIAVQIDFCQHLAPHRADAAAEIAQARPGHEIDEAMKCRAARAVQRIAVTRRAPSRWPVCGSTPRQLADVAGSICGLGQRTIGRRSSADAAVRAAASRMRVRLTP